MGTKNMPVEFYLLPDPDRATIDPLRPPSHPYIRSIYSFGEYDNRIYNDHNHQKWYPERGVKLKVKRRL